MLIGIDGNEANVRERVGVNVWAFELLKQFKRMKVLDSETRTRRDEGQSLPAGEAGTKENNNSFQIYLVRPPLHDLPRESTHWQYRVIPPAKFWTRWRLPIDLYVHGFKGSGKGSDLSGRSDPSEFVSSRRPDVFLSLSHYAPKWAPMPRIVSIMDLSFLHFPEAFKPLVRWQLERWTAESVRNAAHVLTISEFTKQEIVREYGYPEERITVVYPGIPEHVQEFQRKAKSEKRKAILSIKRKYRVNRYLLFVGTQQPKKNLPRLLEAFESIKRAFPEIELVIVGKIWRQFASASRFPASPARLAAKRAGGTLHASRLRHLGFVPDSDLPALISGTECLVLPTLYEGFGIPVLEAMALGTPVAASNTTSIPEVVNGCGVLFDPTSVSDIARGIREILSWSLAKRQEQVKKGMIRAEKFSWEESTKKVLRVIRSFA